MNLRLPLLAFCLAISAAPAFAAGPPLVIVCRPDPEAIVTLNVPSFGTPTIWDAQFADKTAQNIRFSGAVVLGNGNILAAGQEQSVDYKAANDILVELDSRARVIDDKRIKAGTGERSGAIMPLKDGGYIIASTILTGKKGDEKATRLARYGRDRVFRSDIILKDTNFDYQTAGLTLAGDGKSYIAIVHAVNRRDNLDEYGLLFRISEGGKVLWKRAYRPGIANQINNVTALDGKHFVAAGRVRNEDGRMAGWLMGLNDDGTITWQKTYPRGHNAILRSVTVKRGAPDGDHIVAVGQVMPYGDSPGAAWVMELDGASETVWQRYVRATNYNLDARSALAEDDGRVMIMANATVKRGDEDGSNHIRLITLSPRGEVMGDEAYMQGKRAEAVQLIAGGSRERLVIATIDAVIDGTGKKETASQRIARQQMIGPVKPESGPAAPDTMRTQGWVFAATPLPAYNDPCVIRAERAEP
ncbi:MAG: hypothetical protein JWO78_242 [Micavibrio sp.]|nr:hypothetical protein [Micavibrio sp.]